MSKNGLFTWHSCCLFNLELNNKMIKEVFIMLSDVILAALLSVTSPVGVATDVTSINSNEYTMDSSEAGKRRDIRIGKRRDIRIGKRRDIRINDTQSTGL
tara:strand:+ start:346 stop:645 length:300 start_codon:yes stop_codon:yes gene_type:complete